MKNPFSQANRSKYRIRELFEDYFGYSEKIFVEKIVWFPSISKNDLDKIEIPMEFDKRLILTSDSLSNPERDIIGAFNYYNSRRFNIISDDAYKEMFKLLLPEFNLIPDLTNKINEEVISKEIIDFSLSKFDMRDLVDDDEYQINADIVLKRSFILNSKGKKYFNEKEMDGFFDNIVEKYNSDLESTNKYGALTYLQKVIGLLDYIKIE